uniref:Disintegrin domain-containing protein n=1 Tax=Callorhinchus milii TaxID=7868 RepID=A0A4W3GM42_CALMI
MWEHYNPCLLCPQSCKDPCCDASTCQLKPKAKCASVGACCESCQVLPRGRLCRQAVGECDLPEVCSGDRPDCVNNLFKKNGYRCGGGRGHCYNGQCQLADLQCQRIWGPGKQVRRPPNTTAPTPFPTPTPIPSPT